MSEVMTGYAEFEGLLQSVLRERRTAAEAAAGFEQRLKARFAQQEQSKLAPLAFAQVMPAQRSTTSIWFALCTHLAVLVVVLVVRARQAEIVSVKTASIPVLTPPMALRLPPRSAAAHGGGGHHDLSSATQGRLPRRSEQQILPPAAPPMMAPRLVVEPSVVVQKDLKMAESTLPNFGLPSSTLNGATSFLTGNGTGIGRGDGAGVGPGSGGNGGGGVYHIGGSVSAPTLVYEVDPEFSEEARRQKFSGNVYVYLVVDERGNPTHVRVSRPVGLGLDERAVEAVRQYKFKPALKDGKPVKVDLTIEVNFVIF